MGGEVEEQTEIVLQKERNAFVSEYYHFTHLHMPKTFICENENFRGKKGQILGVMYN